MIDLPEAFKERMKAQLGEEYQAFINSYNLPARRGIRVNTLKISVEEFKKISPFALEPIPWEPNGFYVTDEKPGKTLLHAAGLYYVQEPSAMCAAPLLNVQPGERVLDMCAAPGGKGTQLAQVMKGEGIIYLNEVDQSRAKILSSNVERLGITNAVVTCTPLKRLSEWQFYRGSFDKILVDAPCSGEGMFKKEPNAIPEWSPQNVLRCAARQREILNCAANLLRAGGLMVYSTCTFSREEDEDRIVDFLLSHPDFELVEEHKLYPHIVKGEGHYAALLKKKGEGEHMIFKPRPPAVNVQPLKLYRQFEAENLKVSFSNIGSMYYKEYSMPSDLPPAPKVLRQGLCLGGLEYNHFEPDHALAMALKAGEVNTVEVDEKTALSYLLGNPFQTSSQNGWAVVTYLGYPLGWVKVTNGTAKNHLPKGLRINT